MTGFRRREKKGARRQRQSAGADMVSRFTLLLVLFRSMFATAAMIGLIVFAVVQYQRLTHPERFQFRQFEVNGELQFVSREQLQRVLVEQADAGYFSLDLARVKRELEAMSWVRQADLRRTWPDKLSVNVIEQRPVAYWGETACLNRFGEVFSTDSTVPRLKLPYLQGMPGREKQLLVDFLDYQRQLERLDRQLVQLSEDARLDQRLLLADGTVIALGREQHRERLARFAAVYSRELQPVAEKIAALDLRYQHGFSVRWKNQAVAASELTGGVQS